MFAAANIRRAVSRHARAPALTATLLFTIAFGSGCTAAIAAFVGGLSATDGVQSDPDVATRLARMTLLLLISCGVVLLIACASVAGLLLSRASAQRAETAVKIALGATRQRLALECLVDSLMVSLVGGALGGLAAWWTARLVPLLFVLQDAEHLAFSPNRAWLAAVGGLWIVAIAAAAMAPVLAVPHRDPALVLKTEAPEASNASRRLRRGLVIGQIAACLFLLIVAGVIREDLRATLRTARGQLVGTLVVARVNVGSEQYLREVQETVQKVPGVTGAAWVTTLPGARAGLQSFAVELPSTETREIRLDVTTLRPTAYRPGALRAISGRLFGGADKPDACRVAMLNDTAASRYFDDDALGQALQPADGPRVQIVGVLASPTGGRPQRPTIFYYENQMPSADDVTHRDEVFHASASGTTRDRTALDTNRVSSQYFDVFADPPTMGRVFDANDRSGSCRVGVVTESADDSVFGGRAVGAALIDANGQRVDIVGVVRADALGAAQRMPAPMVFMPIDSPRGELLALAVRGRDTSAAFPVAVDAALRVVSGGAVAAPAASLESLLSRTALASERIATSLLGACVLLALVLSLGGVQALMADLVVRRRRELALRVALGASARQVLGTVAREGVRLAVLGAIVGVGVSVVGTPLIGALVVRPRLPTLEAVATAGVAVAALLVLSSVVPGWRAVRVDPRVVMRGD